MACVASRLPEDEIADLSGVFQIARTFDKGEHLFAVQDPATSQFHIRSGMFKTYVITSAGDEFVTGFHLPGDIVGGAQDQDVYVESAVSLESGSVCQLRDEDIANASVVLVGALYKHIAQTTAPFVRHQLNMKHVSAQSRFAGFCLQMMEKLKALHRSPLYLPTPMTRTDIASYLGLTLESLSRVVAKMNRSGVIHAQRDHIEILDLDTLRTLGPSLS